MICHQVGNTLICSLVEFNERPQLHYYIVLELCFVLASKFYIITLVMIMRVIYKSARINHFKPVAL